jgi:hypothetical protein
MFEINNPRDLLEISFLLSETLKIPEESLLTLQRTLSANFEWFRIAEQFISQYEIYKLISCAKLNLVKAGSHIYQIGSQSNSSYSIL